jgi:TetR/AcrR family transcriptional regulator
MTARDLPTGARSILRAATELFAREGFEAVSVGAIAEHAGVSKANVFHHFASKEELILAVMREVSQSHAQFAEGLLEEDGSSADKLRRLIAFEIIEMFGNRQEMRLILREIVDHARGTVRALAQKVFYRNFHATVALFEQGQARGEFRPDFDPAAAAMMLNGATHVFLQSSEGLKRMPEYKRLKNAQVYAEQIFTLLIGGVVTHTAPAIAKPAPRRHKAPA